jgi:hypothetical protein
MLKKDLKLFFSSIVYLEKKVLALLIQLSSSMDMVEEWTPISLLPKLIIKQLCYLKWH